jgi:hypothetical protein
MTTCTIQPVSDFHDEFGGIPVGTLQALSATRSDVLVIAGDSGTHSSFIKVLERLHDGLPRGKVMLPLLGNHEGYGGSMRSAAEALGHFASAHPKTVLVPRRRQASGEAWRVDHRGVAFLCATGWMDVRWARKRPDVSFIAPRMNDFHLIAELRSDAGWAESAGRAHGDFLYDALRLAVSDRAAGRIRAIVCVTHNAPSKRSTWGFRGSPLNPMFANPGWENRLIRRFSPDLWVHGHMHQSFNYAIGRTNVLCNPFRDDAYFFNTRFDPGLVRIL